MAALKRFLYRATGEPGDLWDNLRAELDRLATLAELLTDAGQGAGELVRDMTERMREILERELSGGGSAPIEGGFGRRRR